MIPADVGALSDDGFASLVNHRPDGEEAGQPTSAEIEAAARAAGLAYRHLPVSGPPGRDAIEGTRQVLAALAPGEKVMMFCRSGMRSTACWALARRAEGADPQTLRDAAAAAGYDLSRLPL